MSSHGLQWYGDYINKNTVKALAEDWGSNVVDWQCILMRVHIKSISKGKGGEGIEAAIVLEFM